MKTRCFFVCALAITLATAQPGPDVFAVLSEFDRIAVTPLWPGFEPKRVPLEIFDGHQTWLVRHPAPPADFHESPQHPGVWVRDGRDPTVQANNEVMLAGVRTATGMLEGTGTSARRFAAVMAHETFHVFQRDHHPKWVGNEGELFVYPVEDPELLKLRRLETEALRRALAAPNADGAACWAAAAMRMRQARFAKLPANSADYERGTELNEGLAQYIQSRAEGTPVTTIPDFGAEEVRLRAYAVGQAIATLLDRLTPGWQQKLEGGETLALGDLLQAAGAGHPRQCDFTPNETAKALARAETDTRAVEQHRAEARQQFESQPGWKLVIVAGAQPLMLASFDPLNVQRLDASHILHTRMLQLKGDGGQLEVLGRGAISEAVGPHPLFSGVRRLTLTGFATEPAVRESGGKIVIAAEGFNAEFSNAQVQRGDKEITIVLR